MKKKTEKFGRGGSREGSGRPKQFQNPTTINFKCEAEDKQAVKEKYGKDLNQMFIKWLKGIIDESRNENKTP